MSFLLEINNNNFCYEDPSLNYEEPFLDSGESSLNPNPSNISNAVNLDEMDKPFYGCVFSEPPVAPELFAEERREIAAAQPVPEPEPKDSWKVDFSVGSLGLLFWVGLFLLVLFAML